MDAPPVVPVEHRKWAVICHLSAAGGIFMPWVGLGLGPLIAWLVLRGEHPSVDAHGRESIHFNVSMMIWMAIGGMLPCFLGPLAWILAVGLLALWIACVVMASIKAGEGGFYRYPVTVRFME